MARNPFSQLTSAVANLTSRFLGGKAGGDSAAVDATIPTNVPIPETVEQLKIALDAAGLPSRNAIHVIDLSGVRKLYGERWPQVERKTIWVARRILERRLTNTDMFGEAEGPAYLVIFGQLEFEEAQLKAALIAEEIGKRVIGDQTADKEFRVTSGVGHVGEERTWVDKTNPEVLTGRILESREGTETYDVAAEAQAAQEGKPDTAETDPGSQTQAPARASSPAVGAGTGVPEKQFRTTRGAEFTVVQTGTATSRLERRTHPVIPLKSTIKMVPMEPGEIGRDVGAQRADLKRLQYLYRYIWNVNREIVVTCSCLPARLEESGELVILDVLPENQSFSDTVDLDILTLKTATESLERLRSQDRKILMIVPVHFNSLAAPAMHRDRFFKAVRELPEKVRNLLIAEIVRMPVGTPSSRFVEVTGVLKLHFSQIILELDLDHPDFSLVPESGIKAVATDATRADLPDEDLFRLMDAFASKAETHGLATYIHGLPTLSLISAALGAGFQYVDGDAVLSIAETPETAFRYKLSDIYAELIGAGHA